MPSSSSPSVRQKHLAVVVNKFIFVSHHSIPLCVSLSLSR